MCFLLENLFYFWYEFFLLEFFNWESEEIESSTNPASLGFPYLKIYFRKKKKNEKSTGDREDVLIFEFEILLGTRVLFRFYLNTQILESIILLYEILSKGSFNIKYKKKQKIFRIKLRPLNCLEGAARPWRVFSRDKLKLKYFRAQNWK